MVNIGMNKGFAVADFLQTFWKHSGITTTNWFNALPPNTGCGACNDCKGSTPQQRLQAFADRFPQVLARVNNISKLSSSSNTDPPLAPSVLGVEPNLDTLQRARHAISAFPNLDTLVSVLNMGAADKPGTLFWDCSTARLSRPGIES
eukprot:3938737-Rhodomonas_salina.1